jgi:adenosylcobinamide amidohydrolase
MMRLARSEFTEAASLRVELRQPWLVVSFGTTVRAASWAIVGGGITDTERVAWLEVTNDELRPPVDPRELFLARLRAESLTGAVGLMTSRCIATYSDVTVAHGAVRARCIATVGLGNALRAGDPPWDAARVSTINVLVHASVPLSVEALLEANALASEAKCAAMLEAPLPSRASGLPATGTGTDCIVVTCPRPRRGKPALPYSGKYTPIGAAIGQAVMDALRDGIATWRRDNEP